MVVKLDLRINKQESAQEQEKVGRHYILFLFTAVFVLTAALFMALSGYKYYEVIGKRAEIAEAIQANNDRMTMINIEYQRLSKQNALIETKLDYVLGNIPSVELLYELNDKLIDGIVIESLTMNAASATIKGVAFADEEIVSFSESLMQTAVIDSVSLPTITGDKRNNADVRAFSIDLKLRPIQQIMNDGKLSEKPKHPMPISQKQISADILPAAASGDKEAPKE